MHPVAPFDKGIRCCPTGFDKYQHGTIPFNLLRQGQHRVIVHPQFQRIATFLSSPLPPLRRGLQIDFYHEGLAVKATHYIEGMKSFTHMKYDLLQPK